MSILQCPHRLMGTLVFLAVLGSGVGCAIKAQPLPVIAQGTMPDSQRTVINNAAPAKSDRPAVVTSETPVPAEFATDVFTETPTMTPTATPTESPTLTPTATPTQLLVPVAQLTLPPKSPTPTGTPAALPSGLKGKIAFKSDRLEGEDIFVMNPDGSDVALLTNLWVYQNALDRDAFSPDGRKIAFVREAGTPSAMQIFFVDTFFKKEFQVTQITRGSAAWDPAWSPRGDQIVFTCNMGRGDGVWIVNVDGSGLARLASNPNEWDHHPSWSPDGSQIVFMSNRSGWLQIWVMDADGTNLRQISFWNDWNDWDPVWIKW